MPKNHKRATITTDRIHQKNATPKLLLSEVRSGDHLGYRPFTHILGNLRHNSRFNEISELILSWFHHYKQDQKLSSDHLDLWLKGFTTGHLRGLKHFSLLVFYTCLRIPEAHPKPDNLYYLLSRINFLLLRSVHSNFSPTLWLDPIQDLREGTYRFHNFGFEVPYNHPMIISLVRNFSRDRQNESYLQILSDLWVGKKSVLKRMLSTEYNWDEQSLQEKQSLRVWVDYKKNLDTAGYAHYMLFKITHGYFSQSRALRTLGGVTEVIKIIISFLSSINLNTQDLPQEVASKIQLMTDTFNNTLKERFQNNSNADKTFVAKKLFYHWKSKKYKSKPSFYQFWKSQSENVSTRTTQLSIQNSYGAPTIRSEGPQKK